MHVQVLHVDGMFPFLFKVKEEKLAIVHASFSLTVELNNMPTTALNGIKLSMDSASLRG